MKVEYVAVCEAAKEAVWPRKFLIDLKIVPDAAQYMTLYCDNSGAIENSKEPKSHKRSKYIERRSHLIRETVARGDIRVK